MKEINKILYDILLKINLKETNFKTNKNLILKYFVDLKNLKNSKYELFEVYLTKFYRFCFGLPVETMIKDAIKFKD